MVEQAPNPTYNDAPNAAQTNSTKIGSGYQVDNDALGTRERRGIEILKETLSKSNLGRSSALYQVIDKLTKRQSLVLGSILKEIAPQNLQSLLATALGNQSDWMKNFNIAFHYMLGTSAATRSALREFSLSLSESQRKELWCAISPEGCEKPESNEVSNRSIKIIAASRFLASLNSDQQGKLINFCTKLDTPSKEDFADLMYKRNPLMHPILVAKIGLLAGDLKLSPEQRKDLNLIRK